MIKIVKNTITNSSTSTNYFTFNKYNLIDDKKLP